ENYYVPEQSKIPLFASLGMFIMVLGLRSMLNDIKASNANTSSTIISIVGFLTLATVLFNWFSTTIRENHQGLPSAQLKRSYVLGMYWFIFSEVMFFAAFFGALYYVRNLSVPWIGGEGDKGVTNMLWDGFEAAWPLV